MENFEPPASRVSSPGRDAWKPSEVRVDAESRNDFHNGLTMFGQLTKMTSSLSICVPEMEKLSTTMLEWCKSVDKSFSMLHSELSSLKEEFIGKNLQMHSEFHRTTGEMIQSTESMLQDKCFPRIHAMESRLDSFADKIVQLQEHLFQKMTSVLEMQTNFSSVVNTIRQAQEKTSDEVSETIKAAQQGLRDDFTTVQQKHQEQLAENVSELSKKLEKMTDSNSEQLERLENEVGLLRLNENSLEEEFQRRLASFDPKSLSHGLQETSEHVFTLNQKVANLQMDFHDRIAFFQDGLSDLNRRLSAGSDQDGSELTNWQKGLHSQVQELQTNLSEYHEQYQCVLTENQKTFQNFLQDQLHKESEQDSRILALENAVRLKSERETELQQTESEHANVAKDVHDLVKKVNIIFETVGTLRGEVGHLKSMQQPVRSLYDGIINPSVSTAFTPSQPSRTAVSAKPSRFVFQPSHEKSAFYSNTCSLGYENCFLSRSGLCSETFHLPKKSHYGGFHPVTPPASPGDQTNTEASTNLKSSVTAGEAFRSIAASNVVSMDDTPLLGMNIGHYRNFSGPF